MMGAGPAAPEAFAKSWLALASSGQSELLAQERRILKEFAPKRYAEVVEYLGRLRLAATGGTR